MHVRDGDTEARHVRGSLEGVAGGCEQTVSLSRVLGQWASRVRGGLVPCRCVFSCEIPSQLLELDARNTIPSVLVPTDADGVAVRGSTQRRVEDAGQGVDTRRVDADGFVRVWRPLEVPLSATAYGEEQAEPLNPLAVVRKKVAFACDGAWFNCFTFLGDGQRLSSAGQANMVNKNVKALPAPDAKIAWVRAPSGPWSMLGCGKCPNLCVFGAVGKTCVRPLPVVSGFSARLEGTRALWARRAMGHGRGVEWPHRAAF